MKLSIIVVNYNSWPDVLLQATSFQSAHQEGEMELLVVDNASTAAATSKKPIDTSIKWLDLPENGGFAAGVNAGARVAQGKWLLLLNPDVTLETETLSQVMRLLDSYDSKKQVAVIGTKLTNPDGSIQASAGPFPSFSRIFKEVFMSSNKRRYSDMNPEKSQQVDWVTGAFMLIRKDVFEAVGGFCEDYFLYFEETDFCHKVQAGGYQTSYDPSMSVCHRHPLQNRSTPPIIRVYTRHSRMLFFQRNRPRWESLSMTAMVYCEALFRSVIALIRGNRTYRYAWLCIMDMCKMFGEKKPPLGISVRHKAEKSLRMTTP